MKQTASPWLFRCSVGLALCTLFLIFAGGLVTSTDAGLSVPDWPLSYGQLMPPMVGGIFFEHGHRMIAATVGLLTVLLAFVFSMKEERAWVRRAAWGAVGMVILQGAFGGLTVLLLLPAAVSIMHACLGQTFLCLVTALAVWSSKTWRAGLEPVQKPSHAISFHRLAFALTGFAYLQLILGAVLRHTGKGLLFHILGAFIVGFFSIWVAARSLSVEKCPKPIRQFSLLTAGMVFFQIFLGIGTFVLLNTDFPVIPIPFPAQVAITLHVVTGASVLAFSVILSLLAYRATSFGNSSGAKTRLKDYYELTKPGITITAGITALAGFVLGSPNAIDFMKLFHTGMGTLLIAAGACVLNMLIEKDIDAQMKRTAARPLPTGRLSPGEALFLGTLFSSVALVYLALAVNGITALVAGLTLSVYLYIYTPLKKITFLCTGAGAVAGALPPVMGWTAATGTFGLEALVLFGIMFFWQIPHFFSLAWLYKDDYQQAGLHMLPEVQDEGRLTSIGIFLNAILLLGVSILPTLMGLTGKIYFFSAAALGLWLVVASAQFMKDRSRPIARRLFFASLAYVPILVTTMVFNRTPGL